MADSDNRAIVERFVEALGSGDPDGYESALDEDALILYPQSGERFRGRRNLRALLDEFIAHDGGFRPNLERVIGDDPAWIISPAYTVVRVDGSGEHFTTTGRVRYPDGTEWHLVQLLEVQRGRISQVTSYFAEPFEAPAWRAPYWETSGP
ncbi:MAG TPA: nuclear transport factor 2 family protein [Candidatus Limnocylindrales bacterium]|nr:nuclear transport factor 2 family protein [Candidatus Limnocylindrales bacterium]